MGNANNELGKVEGRAWIGMLNRYTQAQDAPKGLLSLCSLPEAIFNTCTSNRTLYLGYCIYLLDSRVAKGPLVR
jgi:hypothetical protein